MNKRMFELFDQTIANLPDDQEFSLETLSAMMEQFGNLIVNDCMLSIQVKMNRSQRDEYFKGQSDSVAAIREQFGIAE